MAKLKVHSVLPTGASGSISRGRFHYPKRLASFACLPSPPLSCSQRRWDRDASTEAGK